MQIFSPTNNKDTYIKIEAEIKKIIWMNFLKVYNVFF